MRKSRHPEILMFLLAFPLLTLLNACSSYNQALLKRQHQSVSKQIPAFDPAWFKNTQQRHAALFFEIVNGQMSAQPTPARLRPGSLPYQNQQGGQINVIYYNNEQQEIGRYGSEDPTLARSCAGRQPEIRPLQQGLIEILVPADRNIAILALFQGERETARFNIARQMQTME